MNKEKNDFTKMFGIITFSANAQMVLTPEKVKKVAALVNSMNEFNREFAGEAFIQIMEGKTKMYDGKDALRDLNAYAHFHRKEEQMELEMRANYECPLINEVALKMGETGAVAELIEDKALNVETMATDKGDTTYYVERYLNIREQLFFKQGVDIQRLLKVAMDGDAVAVKKVEDLFKKCDLMDFFQELLAVPSYWTEVCRILG